METVKEINDEYGKYKGRIAQKSRLILPGNVYYLEVQKNNSNKIKRKKIGKDGLHLESGFTLLGIARHNLYIGGLKSNLEGITADVIETDDLIGYAIQRKVSIPRNKFPK